MLEDTPTRLPSIPRRKAFPIAALILCFMALFPLAAADSIARGTSNGYEQRRESSTGSLHRWRSGQGTGKVEPMDIMGLFVA